MPEILYTREAQTRIAKFSPTLQRRIKTAIERLAVHPELGKILTGHLRGTGSYRTGDYRILYNFDRAKGLLLILTVGHRKDIYRKR